MVLNTKRVAVVQGKINTYNFILFDSYYITMTNMTIQSLGVLGLLFLLVVVQLNFEQGERGTLKFLSPAANTSPNAKNSRINVNLGRAVRK